MSHGLAGHGWKGGVVTRGPTIPNPHPPTGQEHGSGEPCAGSVAAVPEA